MKEYHGARIAGREELDGLDFPSGGTARHGRPGRVMREGLWPSRCGPKVMNELIEEELTQLVGG